MGAAHLRTSHLRTKEYTYTVRVAYYELTYYKHLFIMNQAEGPNRYILIAFVLNKVRLI